MTEHSTGPEKQRILIRRNRVTSLPDSPVIQPTEVTTTHWVSPERGHEIYSLIGEISCEWAIVETSLDNCIGLLADINSAVITACITAQMMGHAPRCLTIKALAHYRGLTEIEKEAEKLQQRLFEAADKRNRAIHDRIMIETKENTPYRDHRMSKKELSYGLKEFNPKEFKDTIALIKRRQTEVHKLLLLIREQIYAD